LIIIGHPLIPFKPLYKVAKKEELKKTPPKSTILIDFVNKKLVKYGKDNNVPLALHVKSIKDACLANALNVKFIIVEKKLSKEIQKLATEYLFDAKIILQIDNEDDIEIAAQDFIDGVIFKEGII
jgi:hypothetical protein